MDVNSDIFDDLVAAYALDAVDENEAAALAAFVSQSPHAAAVVERLRAAASWIGAAHALEPPETLKSDLMNAARARVRPAIPEVAIQRETLRFESLLDTLDPESLGTPTHNGLTVRDLVAHVEAIDAAFLDALRDRTLPQIGPHEVVEITRARLRDTQGLDFVTVREQFRSTRSTLTAECAAASPDRRAGGYPVRDVLVIRAFETWTHHDDVRAALGRSLSVPSPDVVRAMAELSVRALPFALGLTRRAHPGRTARLVLEGPGGGDFRVSLAPEERAGHGIDVVVRAPVIDWCRLFAARLEPNALDRAVEGDVALADDIVAAAPAFAGL